MEAKVCRSWDEYFDAGAGAVFKSRNISNPEGPRDVWHVRPPCGHMGVLTSPEDPDEEGNFHTVEQDSDGKVTVEPSIQCLHDCQDPEEACWHGFLRNGVWEGN